MPKFTRQHSVQLMLPDFSESIWPVVGKNMTWTKALELAQVWVKAGCKCRMFTPRRVVKILTPKS